MAVETKMPGQPGGDPGAAQPAYKGGEKVAFSSKEKTRFLRALAVLYGSGIVINRALSILADQSRQGDAKDRAWSDAYERMATGLESGRRLSQVVAQYTDFSSVHVRLIELGEESGSLHKILERLAEYEEKRHAITIVLPRRTLTS